MILGICGRKQSGKSSMATFIKQILSETKVKEISFAKPLKDFVHEVLSIPKNNLYGSDADKNHPLCTWGEIFQGPALSKYGKRDRDLLSAREILQLIGTDVMRHGYLEYVDKKLETEINRFIYKKFGPDRRPFENLWIDLAIMDIKVGKSKGEIDLAVISDIRFNNEVDAVKKSGGKIVRLRRDTGCSDSLAHSSELEMQQMPDKLFDFVLFEEDNVNLKQLRHFTTKVLMECGLVETGGLSA